MIAKLSAAALLLAFAASCAALPAQAAAGDREKPRAEAARPAKIAADAKVRQVRGRPLRRQGGAPRRRRPGPSRPSRRSAR